MTSLTEIWPDYFSSAPEKEESWYKKIPKYKPSRYNDDSYAPVNYQPDTAEFHPLFFADHQQVKKTLVHLGTCRGCKLSFLSLFRGDSLPIHQTAGMYGAQPMTTVSSTTDQLKDGLFKLVDFNTLIVVLIFILLLYLIIRKKD